MPLSEHEQRLLDEIEQALYAEDPKFASAVRAVRSRSRARRSVLLCVVGVILGLGMVLVGLVAQVIPVSIVGFVLVVAACGYAAQVLHARGSAPDAAPSSGAKPARQPGLRTRMEDRLRRRFDEN
jgi:hypothetical protein